MSRSVFPSKLTFFGFLLAGIAAAYTADAQDYAAGALPKPAADVVMQHKAFTTTIKPVIEKTRPQIAPSDLAAMIARSKQITERPLLPAGPPLGNKSGFSVPSNGLSSTAPMDATPGPGSETVPGMYRELQSASPQPSGTSSAAQVGSPEPMVSPSSFAILRNSSPNSVIGTSKSNIMEPSTALAGRSRFMTGNWFAAFTNNDGATWTSLSPYTTFSPPAGSPQFCCDQVVLYDPSRDLMIWYLQYVKSGSTASDVGVQKIAIHRGTRAGIKAGGWISYNIYPSNFGGPASGEWFDYPDMALSNDYLWVSTNVFSTTTDSFTRSVVYRVSLDDLAAAQPIPAQVFSQNTVGTLKLVQGAKDIMYFASHLSTTAMRIFKWPETSASPTSVDKTIPAWTFTGRGGHICTTSTGQNWCGRADERVLAGALSWNQATKQGELWWFWNVAQGGSFPKPYIDAAKFRESDLAYLSRPFIWDSNHVFHYIAAAPNARGDIGLSIGWGNPTTVFPNSLVCLDDDYNGDPPGWQCLASRFGTHAPAIDGWGDYLAVRPAYPGGHTWNASAFTQQGGTSGIYTEPKNVVFGRYRDVNEYRRWRDR